MNAWPLVRMISAASRSDRRRLAGVTAGMALAVTLAVMLLSGGIALSERTMRSGWTEGVVAGAPLSYEGGRPPLTREEAAMRAVSDRFQRTEIRTVYIATTPDTSITVPGVGTPPKAGTSYLSPALAELVAKQPPDELGARYGAVTKTLPEASLPGPEAYVALVGVDEDRLGSQATRFDDLSSVPFRSSAYAAITIIGGLAVMLPVVVLLSIVTALGANTRRERVAAIRLVGATPAQAARLAGVETLGTAALGSILGVGLAFALAPIAALIPVDGSSFFVSDLLPKPLPTLIVCIVIVLAAVTLAWIRTRVRDTGPLGGTTDRPERRPRWWWAIALVIGATTPLLAIFTTDIPILGTEQGPIFGFALTAVGLLGIGAAATALVARIGTRHTRSASGVIAFERIARHPRQVFRASSGVVVAVFLVSVLIAAGTAERRATLYEGPDALPITALSVDLMSDADAGIDTLQTQRQVALLRKVPGVTVVGTVIGLDDKDVVSASDATALGFGVPGGAYVAGHWIRSEGAVEPRAVASLASESQPPRISGYVVLTDNVAAVERARTVALSFPDVVRVAVRGDAVADAGLTWAARYAALGYIGTGVATLIAALALAVATASAIADRRRTFALMRLAGTPVAVISRVVLIEALAPLVAVFLGAAALGYGTAWLFITAISQGGRTVGPPSLEYFVALLGCLAAGLAAALLSLGTARRTTDPASVRFE